MRILERYSAVALALCVVTLPAGMPLCRAGEKEAVAAIEKLDGWVQRKDYDPDKPVVAVAFWLRRALSDAELKTAVGALQQLSGLETLILDCTQITDEGLVHLKGLARLSELSLKATRITDAGLKHLEKLSSLKKLDLRLTAVTKGGVESLRKALPRAVVDHSRFDEQPGDAEKLRGRWRLVPQRAKGPSPRGNSDYTLIVVGDELALISDRLLIYLCRFELETAAAPKAMRLFITDVVPGFNSRRDRFQAIYKLQGDTVTVCTGSLDFNERPKAFSSEEGTLYVFKRVDAMKP